MKRIAVAALLYPFIVGMYFLGTKMDAAINSWLPRTGWKTSMWFSQHAPTLLYLNNRPVFWVIALSVPALMTAFITFMFVSNEPSYRSRRSSLPRRDRRSFH